MPNPRNICLGCHHRPSERRAEYDALCQCGCHDIADAAPDLLAACKAAMPGLAKMGGDWSDEMHGILAAAVAKAERGSDAPPP